MTEEIAKTKWCPMVRAVGVEKNNDENKIINCVAFNTCMDRHQKSHFKPFGTTCIASKCALGCDINGNWRGVCGLAGKP